MRLIRRLGPWRLPLAWAAVILVATSLPLPARPWPGEDLPLDKAAHFLLYLGLGWGSARALLREGKRGVLPAAGVLVAGALFAAADEAHQGWILSRTPSVADWTADVVGMTSGLVLAPLRARLDTGRRGEGSGERRGREHVRSGEQERPRTEDARGDDGD